VRDETKALLSLVESTGRSIIDLEHPSIIPINLRDIPQTSYGPHHASPKSKLFWQFWKLTLPSSVIMSDAAIYHVALKHGVRVIHRVPVYDAAQLLPHRQLQALPPPYMFAPKKEYTLKDTGANSTASLNILYIREVTKLLQQENARAFLERGGLVWRIALEFGGPRLWQDVFKGPSVFCVDARIGERSPDVSFIGESIVDSDLDLLLGVLYKPESPSYAKSLFPPYAMFEQSPHWMGVWTADNEDWFQKILGQLYEGTLKAQPRHYWRSTAGRSNKKTITDEIAESFTGTSTSTACIYSNTSH
jgi:hypothetical protein